MLDMQDNNSFNQHDEIGDYHVASSFDTPLRDDAFTLDNETKIELIQKHFRDIMLILGLDLTDDSLKGTPYRVAKMFVNETFSGLDPNNKPKVTLFENKYKFNEMVLVKDISFYTVCEHHFVPFFGKAHVAYIPNGNVAGLSKINRIVDYYSRRPQVQERLNVQIANEIRESFHAEDVAVMIQAKHLCVASRGIQDTHSSTITSKYYGRFNHEDYKNQFLSALNSEDK